MKNILLVTGLLSVATVSLAAELVHSPIPPICGYGGQHCVAFEDQMEHPTQDGYLMQHSVILADGSLGGPHEICVNSEMRFVVRVSTPGTYVEFWKMVQTDDAGNVSYNDYSTQTFFVMDDLSVVPPRHNIFFAANNVAPNCTLTPPPVPPTNGPGEPPAVEFVY